MIRQTSESDGSNAEIFSVSDLNKAAKSLLEGHFPMVFVEGEISNFSVPASGHWYLTLKDEGGQLRTAMFRNRNQRVRFKPRNGLKVLIRGKISLYEARGEYPCDYYLTHRCCDPGRAERPEAAVPSTQLYDHSQPSPGRGGYPADRCRLGIGECIFRTRV